VMRISFFAIMLIWSSVNVSAQYLYGVGAVQGLGFRAIDLNTSQITTLIPGMRATGYYGQSTSDRSHRFFYILDGNWSINAPDTLITIDITNNSVVKNLVPAKTLFFPEYNNN